jgi:hypothetical protein
LIVVVGSFAAVRGRRAGTSREKYPIAERHADYRKFDASREKERDRRESCDTREAGKMTSRLVSPWGALK